ncbi:hypothetical protein [Nocardioides sp. Soil805]|uniref:hypothetical protein n=1 Tax=Nocardioides sp. Soil805 TaxID=1736416 RepID=UPI0007038107|nr:hypothetical protein [Nocardioides sp. Soil805]KRF36530.1 hypothetical protein ASG94_03525 [Nocardioides sp. Soil805]
MAADETPVRRGSPGLPVVVAAVVSGVVGYAVLVLAARDLSASDNADFLVFWGALFGVFGVLVGLTSEGTRSVFAAGVGASTGPGARVVPTALLLGGAVVAVLGLSGPLWAPHLFGDRWLALLPALLVGVALFTVHSALGGATAGSGEWTAYATLVGVESTSRLLLCAVAVVAGARVVGLSWAVAAACGAWIVLSLASARYRRAWGVRADVDRAGLLARMVTACTASGASAVLLVGFPVLLRVTTPDDVFAGAAPLILAVSLSRAPLLVPLGAYQNVVVTKVVEHGVGALKGATELVLAATAVGAVLAYLLGPTALHVVNPSYDVPAWTFAALMVAAGLVCLLTLTGAAALALDHHGAYLVGWLAATGATTVLLLVLQGGLEVRVVVALVLGPVVGIAVHMLFGARRDRLESALAHP